MTKAPFKDANGRFIHMCMEEGCHQHGSFGFDHGAVFFCGQHKHLYEERRRSIQDLMRASPVGIRPAQKVSRETSAKTLRPTQGKLL